MGIHNNSRYSLYWIAMIFRQINSYNFYSHSIGLDFPSTAALPTAASPVPFGEEGLESRDLGDKTRRHTFQGSLSAAKL